jgi:hypothetical protein
MNSFWITFPGFKHFNHQHCKAATRERARGHALRCLHPVGPCSGPFVHSDYDICHFGAHEWAVVHIQLFCATRFSLLVFIQCAIWISRSLKCINYPLHSISLQFPCTSHGRRVFVCACVCVYISVCAACAFICKIAILERPMNAFIVNPSRAKHTKFVCVWLLMG